MNQLLLLRFSAMGDVALLAPVVQAFTQRYPEAEITLVTRAKFAVFFEGFPNIRIVGADFDGQHKGLAGLIRLFNELRQLASFGVVVDAHQNLRSGVLKSLFRLIGVPSVTIDKGRAEKKELTRKENKIRRQLPHSVERYARTFDKAGFTLQPAQPFQFPSFTSAKGELTTFLDHHTVNYSVPWLGIAPFAQHEQKMWPFERFAPLLKQLYTATPIAIFLFGGGASDIAQLETLREQFPQAILVAGHLSLAAELALIRQLTGMLCMDSGNMHLAALSGVPVLSIWGATHPDAGFGPWGQGDEAILQIPVDVLTCRPCSVFGNKPCWRGDLACLNDISVELVAMRVRQMLAR
ncbi:glycosyltransferase family 9 protein [Spirosoma sp. KCTC 42546]|uniref:glycosyltransferase family 9 protein n=1 Tax=Spirosoma sp. KCTC 42546 TaxID=2520506 RepID=UPI00115B5C5E|nr:glycosyltransferase family 9 protein [Spirosoma sp. KCTC 42546]QDK80558.1 glycosyltransferase family 9 protein [Spirosoma sp. KCTC 42546]